MQSKNHRGPEMPLHIKKKSQVSVAVPTKIARTTVDGVYIHPVSAYRVIRISCYGLNLSLFL